MEGFPMFVTEEDAVMKKWCPMVRLRWEERPFAFNRSNPGPKGRIRNMLYRMFFPRLHHEMRGHFFRCQGAGCMMWRWEAKDARPSETRKGYCGLAGSPFAQ
jgi:hypothetical protein